MLMPLEVAAQQEISIWVRKAAFIVDQNGHVSAEDRNAGRDRWEMTFNERSLSLCELATPAITSSGKRPPGHLDDHITPTSLPLLLL